MKNQLRTCVLALCACLGLWGMPPLTTEALSNDYQFTPIFNDGGSMTVQIGNATSRPVTSGVLITASENDTVLFTTTATHGYSELVQINNTTGAPWGWTRGDSGLEREYSFTHEAHMTEKNFTIKATFQHGITMKAEGATGEVKYPKTGAINTPADATGQLAIAEDGEPAKFEITPGSNACLTDLLTDGVSIGAYVGENQREEYTFQSVALDHTLTAVFGAAAITVNLDVDDEQNNSGNDIAVQTDGQWTAWESNANGDKHNQIKQGSHGETLSIPGDVQCNKARYIKIEFNTMAGYDAPQTILLDMLKLENKTITGQYNLNMRVLTAVAEHGTVYFDPPGERWLEENRRAYVDKAEVILTAANTIEGWYFTHWSENGVPIGTSDSITLIMDQDRTLTAVFAEPCQDADGDGHSVGDMGTGCAVTGQIDCDDTNPLIYPGAPTPPQGCGTGIAWNCVAPVACSNDDKDNDADSYSKNQGDCDDSNPNIHPGVYDDPENNIDEDCFDGPKEKDKEVTCVEISDVPIRTAQTSAPPLLMFLLDDSGSMDWEFITRSGGASQLFPASTLRYMIYPHPTIQSYYNSTSYLLNSVDRTYWKSRWSSYNRIFFNPQGNYIPWPRWEELREGATSNAACTSQQAPCVGPVRAYEHKYTGSGSFPNTAYSADYTHADMDRPRFNTRVFTNNNKESPMFHPGDAATQATRALYEIDLNALYLQITLANNSILQVPTAHYFVLEDTNGNDDYDPGEAVYLVTIPGQGHKVGDYTLKFYKLLQIVNASPTLPASGQLLNKQVTEVPWADVPATVMPQRKDVYGNPITDPDELAYVLRQDFADWFQFYRRRLLTLKAAIGQVVVNMSGVAIGLYTINDKFVFPLTSTDLNSGADLAAHPELDPKLAFLRTMYNVHAPGSTPLRTALYTVGKYFQQGSAGDNQNLISGTRKTLSPWRTTTPNFPQQFTEGCEVQDYNKYSVFWKQKENSSDDDACGDAGGECQRAYVIALTDGEYNDSFSSTGNIDSSSQYPALRDGKANMLADIAMYFYDTNLTPGQTAAVPAKGYDINTDHHLVTYTVSFGVPGKFNPELFPDCLRECSKPGQGGCLDLGDLGTLNISAYNAGINSGVGMVNGVFPGVCPDWDGSGANTIDDLYHASVNGRGKFLNAGSPEELVDALNQLKDMIVQSSGSAAAATISGNRVQEGTLAYTTQYDSKDWSGNVQALCMNSTGAVSSCVRVECESACTATATTTISTCSNTFTSCKSACDAGDETCVDQCSTNLNVCLTTAADSRAACATACTDDGNTQKWSAHTKLTLREANNRQIITSGKDDDATFRGMPFRWSDLPHSIQSAIDTPYPLTTTKENLVNYIRGDHSKEVHNGGNFRNRVSKLGDFINSEPYYYKNTALGIEWLFAGANDGMLHVFDATTGEEIFAYIPQAVFANLPLLSRQDYNDNHKFFVDGYLTIQNLGQRVILVGGLGKGGKGFYALDLTAAATHKTNIEAHAEDIVLWEYSTLTDFTALGGMVHQAKAADSAASSLPALRAEGDYLGYSFSRPQIVRSNDANNGTWSLVFANGYTSANGRAALFILGLDTNGHIKSRRILDTGAGGAPPDCNGLSSPALLYPQADGHDDFIYAGDLLGNLWKFDMSDANADNWEIYFQDAQGVGQPLFQAKSTPDYRQPITMRPVITSACPTGEKGYMIYFGTGRLLSPVEDFPDQAVQSLYGIWDWSAAWHGNGVDPKHTYLGSLGKVNSSIAGNCNTQCVNNDTACISDCESDAECLLECSVIKQDCVDNCNSARTLDNMSNIVGSSMAPYVTLLRQIQVWGGGVNRNADGTVRNQKYDALDKSLYNEIIRVMSPSKKTDWYLPSEHQSLLGTPQSKRTPKHVGWHFDLPINGERIVWNMLVQNFTLAYTSSIPATSPCQGGGTSYSWGINSCNGGHKGSAFFINIGRYLDATNQSMSASGVGKDGLGGNTAIYDTGDGNARDYDSNQDDLGGGSSEGPPGGNGNNLINWGNASLLYWSDEGWKE